MKAKVIKKFRDKITKKIHEADTVIIVSAVRFEEINNAGHGILLEEIKPKSKKQV